VLTRCKNHTSTSQTDGRTDGQTTYCRITALCVASRGKNLSTCSFVHVHCYCYALFQNVALFCLAMLTTDKWRQRLFHTCLFAPAGSWDSRIIIELHAVYMCSRTVVGRLVTTWSTTMTSNHVKVTRHQCRAELKKSAMTLAGRHWQAALVAVFHPTAALHQDDPSSRNLWAVTRQLASFSSWDDLHSVDSSCSLKSEYYQWTAPLSAAVRRPLNELRSVCNIAYHARHANDYCDKQLPVPNVLA